MPKFVADKTTINLTVRNFKGTQVAARAAAAASVGLAGHKLLGAVRQNVSVQPIGFDLPDGGRAVGTAAEHAGALAEMDHPYARRHPVIKYRPKDGGVKGFKPRHLLVHTVTGDLLKSIRGVFDPKSLEFRIATDESKAPHVKYVIQGTRVMHPRDILSATGADRGVRREILLVIRDVFGRLFRSKASLRFT